MHNRLAICESVVDGASHGFDVVFGFAAVSRGAG